MQFHRYSASFYHLHMCSSTHSRCTKVTSCNKCLVWKGGISHCFKCAYISIKEEKKRESSASSSQQIHPEHLLFVYLHWTRINCEMMHLTQRDKSVSLHIYTIHHIHMSFKQKHGCDVFMSVEHHLWTPVTHWSPAVWRFVPCSYLWSPFEPRCTLSWPPQISSPGSRAGEWKYRGWLETVLQRDCWWWGG